MKFVFEGEGDPRDRETFLASSYLELNHVKISELAEQFSSAAWEQFPQREQLQDVALTGKLWTVKLPAALWRCAVACSPMVADRHYLKWPRWISLA